MDSTELDLSTIGSVGISGMLVTVTALILRSILTGKLVPRRVLEDAVEALNKALDRVTAERDTWRDVALSKDATIKAQADALDDAMEIGRTVNHVVNSLPRPVSDAATT